MSCHDRLGNAGIPYGSRPATPLSTHLPTNVLRSAEEDAQSLWATCWQDGIHQEWCAKGPVPRREPGVSHGYVNGAG